ncbi:molybdopterin converting factor subunit 1 [uncultured Parasphingopyxis sp.]|uniref:molybdopterin converting factor subunit 1 n=1 Tax=uncultured Parasphingopyxis sp. TaxID=1547918 RepID=UPI0026038E3A|nr:molybdopterin converting factor subunit 1 [uncultured Parasphingopyxis sp.]
MAIEMVYFAWVREAIGRDGETVDPPDDVTTLGALVDWLAQRGDGYREALGDPDRLRGAVDQVFAPFDASIEGVKEVALFPPVTGG